MGGLRVRKDDRGGGAGVCQRVRLSHGGGSRTAQTLVARLSQRDFNGRHRDRGRKAADGELLQAFQLGVNGGAGAR